MFVSTYSLTETFKPCQVKLQKNGVCNEVVSANFFRKTCEGQERKKIMAIRPSQAVAPRFGELANVKCISEFIDNPVYENNKRTGTNGVKADFLVMSGELTGFVFTAKFERLPSVELMQDYRMSFDTEKSTVYVQNGQLGLSLWANGLEPLKKQQ